MFLYPLAIVLILLALFGKFFRHDRAVYISTIVLTFVAALYDLLRTLPEYLRTLCHLDAPLEAVGSVLPLADVYKRQSLLRLYPGPNRYIHTTTCRYLQKTHLTIPAACTHPGGFFLPKWEESTGQPCIFTPLGVK